MSENAVASPAHEDASPVDAANIEPGRDDLSLGGVFKIFWRTWPFIRPSLKHLIAFVAISGIIGVIGVGLGGLLVALATTGIMSADPLGSAVAALYDFDPSVYVNVDKLSDDARRALAWPTVNTAIVLTLIGVTAGFSLYYYSIWIFQSINQRMRVQLIDRLQAQFLAYHARAETGDAIYRLHQDSAMVTAIIRPVFLEPIMFLGRYLGGIVIVMAFSPQHALILGVTSLPLILLGRYVSPRLRLMFRTTRESNSALTSWIQESVQGIRVVKATASEADRTDEFERRPLRALGAAFRSRVALNLLGILSFAIIGIATIVLQSYAAWWSHQETSVFARDLLLAFGFAVWNFGTFGAAGSRWRDATGSLRGLINLWGRAQDMAVGLGRVFEIMDLEPDIRDRHGASVLAPLAEAVTFDDVSFSYIAGKPVLNGISARATAGTITAIIGPTGTGKSTLMSLLLRLADVDEGRIAIDGTDIRDLTIASLRACISIAMQENILFSDTVCENIRYAAPNANLADVIAAARVACADEFVGELPDGYDTPFGERASRLSTGQRQRLVLARAIVRDTPILILDEPTSALDARTELTVLSNLKDWGKPQGLRRGTLHFSDYASAVDYSPRQPGHLPD